MSLLGIERCSREGEDPIPLAAFFIPFTLPDGIIAVPYVADTGAAHGTPGYTFTKIAGPAWMSVDPVTGAITGTPDAVGSGITVTVRVTDSLLATADVTQTIDIVATPLLTAFFDPTPLPDGYLGVPYTADTNYINGQWPITFTKIAGPAWVNVHVVSGQITGTPDAEGTGITITVRATDALLATSDVTDTINIAALIPPPDMYVGGEFTLVDGAARTHIARVSSDGVLEPTFNPVVAGFLGNEVHAIAVQDNGDVLFGGFFSTVDGNSRFHLARVSPSGVVDPGFSPLVSGSVFDIHIDTDYSILIAGDFGDIGGVARIGLARINYNGTLHPFNANIAPATALHAIAVRPDGKIAFGGFSFATVGGVARNYIAQVNGDGTLDAAFVPALFNGRIRALALQADGKLIVGGDFQNVDGIPWRNVARLNTNGSNDAGFHPLAGPVTRNVYAVAVQPDGKILVGGNFDTISATSQPRLARLNPDATIDAGFAPVINFEVFSIVVEDDGRILIGGGFTLVNGVARTHMARLNADGTLDLTFDPSPNDTVNAIAL